MTAADKAALRALAENAVTSHGEQAFMDAYIAAANPAAVLALLDDVARLREALDKALPCLVAANTVSVREIYAAKALALVALKDPRA